MGDHLSFYLRIMQKTGIFIATAFISSICSSSFGQQQQQQVYNL
jgi:hypothetical protein